MNVVEEGDELVDGFLVQLLVVVKMMVSERENEGGGLHIIISYLLDVLVDGCAQSHVAFQGGYFINRVTFG